VNLNDTIVAISTPPGAGGIGIVRLSGPDAKALAGRLLLLSSDDWRPRYATVANLIDSSGDTVDQVIATYFAGPASYTGQDVVEISCHGSPVVLRHAVERALSLGARSAEPGEFTLRAYMNGRIDLPQAEAVHDLIQATTLYQARVAARQLEGSVSQALKPWKEQLVELIALLEAGIDFAEDDVSVASFDEIRRRIQPVLTAVRNLAASYSFGRLVHEGITLAIAGRPNVGKSSLFNRLLEQDRAIVTDIPGTTRDTVSESAVLSGIPVKLVDTAGIRQATELVEKLGIERSYQAMAEADLTIVVLDLSEPLTSADHAILERARSHGDYLIAGNKADLPRRADPSVEHVAISALSGAGIDELRKAILAKVAPHGVYSSNASFITTARHATLLRECAEALEQAGKAAETGLPHELLLLDCYAALRPLDAITGATTADDILNRIFSTFCIGK